MIAAIVRGGRSASYSASLNYVLHDHDGVGTERVGEVETVNLFSDASHADKEMQTTADAGRAIQARARAERGERTGASGSRAEKTCFHYALSWHPDDQPDADHMFKAARASLDRLGLTEHQAVIVQHLEPDHAHLHVIVSTVHPETGRANGLHQKTYILDRWCHEYEKGQQMIRTFDRASKYEREHEWAKKPAQPKPVKDMSPDEKKQAWNQRRRELSVARERDNAALREKFDQKKQDFEERIEAIKRSASLEKERLREKHRDQINEHWRKKSPNPAMAPRPSASFLRPMMTDGGEMGRALRALLRTTNVSTPAIVERRKMEQNKGIARDTFVRAKENSTPLQPPSPSDPPRSVVHGQFRERSTQSRENQLRHFGITDRHDGAQAIKRWQKQELEQIDRITRNALEDLRKDYGEEVGRHQIRMVALANKHDRLLEDVKREFGIPTKADELQAAIREEKEERRAGQRGHHSKMNVRTYVDDYIAGLGRDSAEHEQFAANYGTDIEAEFHRRAEQKLFSEGFELFDLPPEKQQLEPAPQREADEPSPEEPPPHEPDAMEPAYPDFEIGD